MLIMKTMLMTWFSTGTFLGAVIGLIVYIIKRDTNTAMLAGFFGGFVCGAAAAAMSGYIDQRVSEQSQADSAQEQESRPGS